MKISTLFLQPQQNNQNFKMPLIITLKKKADIYKQI